MEFQPEPQAVLDSNMKQEFQKFCLQLEGHWAMHKIRREPY
jgi:hypothetical protein